MLTNQLPSTWKVSIAILSAAEAPTSLPKRTLIGAVRIPDAVWVMAWSRPLTNARRQGKV